MTHGSMNLVFDTIVKLKFNFPSKKILKIVEEKTVSTKTVRMI